MSRFQSDEVGRSGSRGGARRRGPFGPFVAALALATSCASTPSEGPARQDAADSAAPAGTAAPATVGAELAELELAPDWLALSPEAFGEYVDRSASTGMAVGFTAGSRARLTEALAEPGEPAVRAAVLLAHAAAHGDRDAREALIARLERRAHAPSRSEAGGDVVAAAGLATAARDSGDGARPDAGPDAALSRRLAALALGERAHPELDVRVECARVALAGGRDEVAPFLLAVLRAETPDQALAPRDWERTTSLYWAKARAAEALNRRSQAAVEFRPDASWQDQVTAANTLEAALRAAGALR